MKNLTKFLQVLPTDFKIYKVQSLLSIATSIFPHWNFNLEALLVGIDIKLVEMHKLLVVVDRGKKLVLFFLYSLTRYC